MAVGTHVCPCMFALVRLWALSDVHQGGLLLDSFPWAFGARNDSFSTPGETPPSRAPRLGRDPCPTLDQPLCPYLATQSPLVLVEGESLFGRFLGGGAEGFRVRQGSLQGLHGARQCLLAESAVSREVLLGTHVSLVQPLTGGKGGVQEPMWGQG